MSGRDYWAHSDYLVEIVAPVPTISGTAVPGQILTAKAGNWSPTPSSLSYQWKRGGTNVAGATASTYRVTNDDAGKQLTVTVTAKFTGAASVSKTSAAVTAKGYKTTRLAGDDRYATAVSVSKAAFPDGGEDCLSRHWSRLRRRPRGRAASGIPGCAPSART